MSTSLLMEYVEIAKLLMENGHQSTSQIKSFKKNLNSVNLEQILNFLSENKIITQKITGANLDYDITKRGIGLLDFFKVKPPRATIKLKR